MKDCDCEDYKTSMNQIIAARYISYEQGYEYTGKVFKYCPWCGKKMEPIVST